MLDSKRHISCRNQSEEPHAENNSLGGGNRGPDHCLVGACERLNRAPQISNRRSEHRHVGRLALRARSALDQQVGMRAELMTSDRPPRSCGKPRRRCSAADRSRYRGQPRRQPSSLRASEKRFDARRPGEHSAQGWAGWLLRIPVGNWKCVVLAHLE
jgi:hypothetical protein